MKKDKPLLHLVRSSSDPTIYNADLDFYFGEYQSICGVSSVGISDEYREPPMMRESNWYSDRHLAAFTRARKIWQALQGVSFYYREVIERLYTPRQYYPPELQVPDESVIRQAHVAYYAARGQS